MADISSAPLPSLSGSLLGNHVRSPLRVGPELFHSTTKFRRPFLSTPGTSAPHLGFRSRVVFTMARIAKRLIVLWLAAVGLMDCGPFSGRNTAEIAFVILSRSVKPIHLVVCCSSVSAEPACSGLPGLPISSVAISAVSCLSSTRIYLLSAVKAITLLAIPCSSHTTIIPGGGISYG